jgi:copper chaperone NosL
MFKHDPDLTMKRKPALHVSLACLSLAALLLSACSKELPPPVPQMVTQGTLCSLDGMTLMDYPGPKAQIQYADGTTEFFCDTVEMFSIALRPEQQKRIRAIYTQDMAKADWREPKGQWIAARGAFYVRGSSQRGSMGPTLAAFAARADAEDFARKYGGSVLAFGEVTIDMVDLHGGAVHDGRM